MLLTIMMIMLIEMLILMLSAAPDEGELASFKLIGPCIVPKSNNNNDNSNNSHIMIVKRL